jgi:hypothetical protein
MMVMYLSFCVAVMTPILKARVPRSQARRTQCHGDSAMLVTALGAAAASAAALSLPVALRAELGLLPGCARAGAAGRGPRCALAQRGWRRRKEGT